MLREVGMKQSELALKTGLDRREISFFCTNRRHMTFDNALSIADTIGCDIRDLYEVEEIKLSNSREDWSERKGYKEKFYNVKCAN
jgi:plasmid maintenance system antidote protein VapI